MPLSRFSGRRSWRTMTGLVCSVRAEWALPAGFAQSRSMSSHASSPQLPRRMTGKVMLHSRRPHNKLAYLRRSRRRTGGGVTRATDWGAREAAYVGHSDIKLWRPRERASKPGGIPRAVPALGVPLEGENLGEHRMTPLAVLEANECVASLLRDLLGKPFLHFSQV